MDFFTRFLFGFVIILVTFVFLSILRCCNKYLHGKDTIVLDLIYMLIISLFLTAIFHFNWLG